MMEGLIGMSNIGSLSEKGGGVCDELREGVTGVCVLSWR